MGQHITAVPGYHHIVLNADPDASPLLVHAVVVRRHIESRFHGQCHSRLQLPPLVLHPIVAHIMHIQTQPVTGAMHEETPVAFGFHQLVELPLEQAQIQQPLGEDMHHFFVGHIPVIIRMGSRDGGVLTGQNQFVKGLLGLAECAIHREGTGNVRGIVFQLATGIHQHQIAVFQFLAVFDVVQDATVGAATDNARIGRATRAVAHEFVDIFRFQLILHHARLHRLHGPHMGAGRNTGSAAHQLDFGSALEQTHVVKMVCQGNEFPGGLGTGADPLTDTVNPAHQTTIEFRIVTQVVIDPLTALDQARQDLVDITDGKSIIRIKIRHGPIGAGPVAVPDFHGAVALAAEQHILAVLPARQQHHDRLRFAKPGQVPEVTVLPIGVFHIPVTGAFRGRRQDGNAVGPHDAHQFLAATGEFLAVDTQELSLMWRR